MEYYFDGRWSNKKKERMDRTNSIAQLWNESSEFRAMVEAVRMDILNPNPKLRLADWLQENVGEYGQSRSDLIRIQVALQTMPEDEEQRKYLVWKERLWRQSYSGILRSLWLEGRGSRTSRFECWSVDQGRYELWLRADEFLSPSLQETFQDNNLDWIIGVQLSWCNDAQTRRIAQSPSLKYIHTFDISDLSLAPTLIEELQQQFGPKLRTRDVQAASGT